MYFYFLLSEMKMDGCGATWHDHAKTTGVQFVTYQGHYFWV